MVLSDVFLLESLTVSHKYEEDALAYSVHPVVRKFLFEFMFPFIIGIPSNRCCPWGLPRDHVENGCIVIHRPIPLLPGALRAL